MTDTCSIGRVIDALVAIPTLPQYASVFADVVVCDGPWLQSSMPNDLVLIGLLAAGDADNAGTQQPRTLGVGGTVEENYAVVCQIYSWSGDVDAGAQKARRDRVLELFASFEETIRSDRTLNDLIVKPPSQQPVSVWIESQGLVQTSDDVTQGRFAQLQFAVHVQNVLQA